MHAVREAGASIEELPTNLTPEEAAWRYEWGFCCCLSRSPYCLCHGYPIIILTVSLLCLCISACSKCVYFPSTVTSIILLRLLVLLFHAIQGQYT